MTVLGRPAGGLNPPRPTRLPVAGNQEPRHAQETVNTDLGSIRAVAPPDRPACARWESQRHAGNRLANKPAARRATVNAIFGLDVASWPEKIDPHKLRDWCRVRHLVILVAAIALLGNRHDRGINHLAATRNVALGLQMLAKVCRGVEF